MKKFTVLVLLLFCLLLTSCSSNVENKADNSVEYDKIIVSISTEGSGIYCTYADVSLNYWNGELAAIEIIDPTLLSFKVSDRWKDGVFLLNMEEGTSIINTLKAVSAELKLEGKTDQANKIDAILEQLELSGPITGAST